jgi:GNAT superfamily N-acetyltransferase
MNAVLRQASPQDSAEIAEILLASRAAFLVYAPSPHSDNAIRAWVCDILLPREDITVASVDGHMVGVMATHRPGAISWITQLYLHPSHVARGIGSQLLTLALATLPRPIRLYTFQQNTGARRFYERNGFLPIQFSDGAANDERCPDVLYELTT